MFLEGESAYFSLRLSETLNEMVNSKSDFNENLVKKDRIDFTSEVVEKVYEFLPSEQKYVIDEAGNVLKIDPIGVVRTALEIMEYQLDPSWYAWGTEAPRTVDKVKVSENIRWNEAKDFFFSTEYNSKYSNLDNDQKIKIQNRILRLPINTQYSKLNSSKLFASIKEGGKYIT